MNKSTILMIILSLALLAVLICCYRFLKNNAQKIATSPKQTVIGKTYPLTIKDALDDTIVIDKEPKRIISLAPGATEILFAVGSGDRVVGVSEYSSYPEEAMKLPIVGSYTTPSIEKITELKPDLVVAQRGNNREALQKIKDLKINVIAVDPVSFSSLNDSINIIGKVTNGKNTDDLIKTINIFVSSIREKGEKLKHHPKVLFLFSPDGALYSAGPDSHIDELITIAGGKNIANDAASAWPQLSMEVVSAKDPDIILITKEHSDSEKVAPIEKIQEQFKKDKKWQNITAVKKGNIFYVDENVTILGPRLVNGLDEVYNIIEKTQNK